jgi:hypothetical protein
MSYFESFAYLRNKGWKASELDALSMRQVKALAAQVAAKKIKRSEVVSKASEQVPNDSKQVPKGVPNHAE